MYGLKQAPRAWYAKIDGFLLSLSFVQCNSDHNVYLKLIHGYLMIILFLFGWPSNYRKFKERDCLLEGCNEPCIFYDRFGIIEPIFGSQIAQYKHGIKVHQFKYSLYFLNKFNMKYWNPSKTPFLSGVKLEEAGSSPMVNNTLYRQLIGCLLYLTHTWPDFLCHKSGLNIHGSASWNPLERIQKDH